MESFKRKHRPDNMGTSEIVLQKHLRDWRAIHVNTFNPRKVKWEYVSWHIRSIAPTYQVLETVANQLWIDPEYTTMSALLRYLKWETGKKTLDKERKLLYDKLHNESNRLSQEEGLWTYKSKWRKYRRIIDRTREPL